MRYLCSISAGRFELLGKKEVQLRRKSVSEIETETDRQTGRQTDRQRQKGRERDRE